MKSYILMYCTIILAAISLVLSCVSYLVSEPVKVCPNRLVERPVAHPTHSPTPTLVVPGKS